MLQEIQDCRKVSATSYNKPGHTTQGPLLDSKTEKEILVEYKKFKRIFNNL
jgi:hypothetical protein